MRKLRERMKPVFIEMIEAGKDESEYYYNIAVKALETEWEHLLTFNDLVAITHFTHTDKSASLYEFISMFKDR